VAEDLCDTTLHGVHGEKMPVVWNLAGSNFTHTSNGHTGRFGTLGKLPKEVEWSLLGEGEATFYLDGMMRDAAKDPSEKPKFGWVLESKSIRPQLIPHLKKEYLGYFEIFRAIFTHNQELLALDNRFRFCIWGGSWILYPRIYTKSKLISAVNSGKNWCDGHRWRNEFIERHRDRFDLFGNSTRHIAHKEIGLNDYMFSIAIENSSYATYFTEKILDCFATGTIQIYRGAPDIGDYFNVKGIIMIDDDAGDFDFDQITPDLYFSKLDAVRDNFERVQKMHCAEDWIYRTYRGELF